jgi:uncharacterized protein (TIGR02145 family)
MKNKFLRRSLLRVAALAVTISLVFNACKKSEDPAPAATAPVLTTSAPASITATTAAVGGNITANGGKDITEAGVVMSVLKPMPTTADEKKTTTTFNGAYTINLTGLTSGTTYFVRAYAINSVGTSYGDAVILATGNLAPEAKNVTVTGTPSITQKLTGTYAYSDPENNAELGSTFKWYRANDAAGAGETAIDGATKIDYTLVTADVGKFIRFGVTPKAAAGTSTGVEVKSAFTAAISAAPNAAPTATITSVSGLGAVDEKLTVVYTYTDGENDAESGTSFKWYVADNASGLNEAEIAGETTTTLLLKAAQLAKFVRVGVTPNAATGTQLGTEVKSAYTGPINAELTSVTFTYNGNMVTYGIIKSSVTNKKWLDRNLGAPNTPTAYNDYANLGDLFQWGRLADGHQLVVRTPNSGDPFSGSSTSVNAFTTNLSSSDVPGNNNFIKPPADPYDWRITPNDNLWQGVNGINNPCPAGWRIPTVDDWSAENLGSNAAANFTQMKITNSGKRFPGNAAFGGTNGGGYYWTSNTNGAYATNYIISSGSTPSATPQDNRGSALAIRCVKN